MSIAAIKMLRHGADRRYVHLPTIAGDGCEGGKLRYWGLAVEESEEREDGGRSGWWMLTPLGVGFVKNLVRVPSHARVYDGRLLGLVGENVNIVDCLGEKFSYVELMSS